MGCARNEIAGSSEVLLSTVKVIASIPANVLEGQMSFVKRTTGDSVYIGLKGKIPSATQYDILLTDTFPSFTEEGIVPGEIKALGSVVTSIVSTYISFSLRG